GNAPFRNSGSRCAAWSDIPTSPSPDSAPSQWHTYCRMPYSFIDCEDGVDTVALQNQYPELFNVTEKDGVTRWTLRPDVRAALRAPIDIAQRRWEAARLRLDATQDDGDKAAA